MPSMVTDKVFRLTCWLSVTIKWGSAEASPSPRLWEKPNLSPVTDLGSTSSFISPSLHWLSSKTAESTIQSTSCDCASRHVWDLCAISTPDFNLFSLTSVPDYFTYPSSCCFQCEFFLEQGRVNKYLYSPRDMIFLWEVEPSRLLSNQSLVESSVPWSTASKRKYFPLSSSAQLHTVVSLIKSMHRCAHTFLTGFSNKTQRNECKCASCFIQSMCYWKAMCKMSCVNIINI